MRRISVTFVLLLLLAGIALSGTVAPAQATTTSRNGSFTTDRGTAISLNSTLEHDGSDGATPELFAERDYTLTVVVTMTELGDARDFHDMEFTVEMTTESLLGSGKPVYSAYYFDSATRLTEAGQSKTYSFTIFLTGEIEQDSTDLDIVFKGKEDVENMPDPSSEFENLGYIVNINPSSGADSIVTAGSEVENRVLQVPTSEGSSVKIEVDFTHDGKEDGKPTIGSNQFYNVTVNFTILELGADPDTIKNLEVFVEIEDSSITDYIPGNSAVKYFSAYGTENQEFLAGDSKVFSFHLIASTNLNDTEVSVRFKFKLTEDIPNAFDNDEEFELAIETFLNKGISNAVLSSLSDSDAPQLLFAIFALISIPIIVRRRH